MRTDSNDNNPVHKKDEKEHKHLSCPDGWEPEYENS